MQGLYATSHLFMCCFIFVMVSLVFKNLHTLPTFVEAGHSYLANVCLLHGENSSSEALEYPCP